ncbi:MAG: alpha/beta fold hydrolase [bacterium]
MRRNTLFYVMAIMLAFSIIPNNLNAGELLKEWYKPDDPVYEEIYRPTPILFLHGFGPGSPETWGYLAGKLSEDHYKLYFIPPSPTLPRLQGPNYLERIDFQDKNGSVDTYPNGNPGWSDKVNDAMSNILQRYDKTDKVVLICHSMGGLAGRYYMQALGGDGNTDKYVSIDTPHCGAVLADIANTIEVAQFGSLIFGGLGGFLFAAITEVINQSAVVIGDIDIHGDAVNDMDPDGEFITNLINMGTGDGAKSRCVVGQIGSAKNFLLFGSYYGGDGVVSVRTQQAIDKDGHTTWDFYDTCVVTASHSNAPKNSKTYNQILKWVDKERPELGLIRVLESDGTPEAEENNLSTLPEGDWGEKDTHWTEHVIGEDSEPFLLDLDKYGRACVEGKVDEEYLPATTKVDIKVYKEGETTSVWENTPKTSLLKPYAGMQPAPAGFRYEVLFAKNKDTAPEPGVYEIKIFVENPAGLKSEEKTVKVRIGAGHYFHVSLSPEYVVTGSPVSQTQTFTITVQCYNYGTSETKPDVEGERYVDKKAGTESWWHYVNDGAGIDEWRKEKINPNCVAPEEWAKSDYTGEVSFGIANITNNDYELYTGEDKLEKITLADGTSSISGVVVKAEDGDISNDHLFLIISASDGAGDGNGALIVNPLIIPCDHVKNQYWKDTGPVYESTWNEAWDLAYAEYQGTSWIETTPPLNYLLCGGIGLREESNLYAAGVKCTKNVLVFKPVVYMSQSEWNDIGKIKIRFIRYQVGGAAVGGGIRCVQTNVTQDQVFGWMTFNIPKNICNFNEFSLTFEGLARTSDDLRPPEPLLYEYSFCGASGQISNAKLYCSQ